MSYPRDKQAKKEKILKTAGVLCLLALVFYFRAGIFSGFSALGGKVFHPAAALGRAVSGRLGSIGAYFSLKSSLYAENEKLREELLAREAKLWNYGNLLAENESLKEILRRAPSETQGRRLLLAAILAKPGRSAYDTLLIDAGTFHGLSAGNMVYAAGDIPIGRVAETSQTMSKVILFSTARERTTVTAPGAFGGTKSDSEWEIVGRGGGNFEMILPRDFALEPGATVHMPGARGQAVAVVADILSDQRDPFKKALLASPVNIQNLKFVEVEL